MKNIFCVITVGLFILGIVNLIPQSALPDDSFFKVTFLELVNVWVIAVLAVYIAEQQSDKRQKKEATERLANKILLILEMPVLCKINSDDDLTIVKLKQRELNNKLSVLEKYKLLDKNNMEYMQRELDEYWKLISEHITDFEYLKNSEHTLNRHISNIRDKLEESIVRIYE